MRLIHIYLKSIGRCIYSVLAVFLYSIIGLLLSFYGFKTHSATLTDKQFIVNYDIEYLIDDKGEVKVNQDVTLINQKNDVVPTNYNFTMKNQRITNAEAETNGKSVNPIVKNTNEGSELTLSILNPAIGKDRKNKISLSYTVSGITKKTGGLWVISIPKIQVPDSTEVYNVKVSIPNSFGPKMYFSPSPILEKNEGDFSIYYLTKDTFKGSGVSAAFGASQIVNFRIKYQLENNSIFSTKYDIPLPPDIKKYQQVSYTYLEPKPLKIYSDEDGNSIARYKLKPKEKTEIELIGSVKLSTPQIDKDKGSALNMLSKQILSKYTKNQEYWVTDSRRIIELVESLKNNNTNIIRNAEEAYNYVVNNLEYDFDAVKKDTVERQGSEIALTQKGKWTCMEYSDLLITILRAMGIPAREINGYAINEEEYSKPIGLNFNNGDLLHAWVEYYDPGLGWIQIDPTWGSTSEIDYFNKTDTNHFALVRKGISSKTPFPPGTYRFKENTNEKMIDIAYNENIDKETFVPNLSAVKSSTLNIFKIIAGQKKYSLTNNGDTFIYFQKEDKELILAPKQNMDIFLPKDTEYLEYMNINGSKYYLDL